MAADEKQKISYTNKIRSKSQLNSAFTRKDQKNSPQSAGYKTFCKLVEDRTCKRGRKQYCNQSCSRRTRTDPGESATARSEETWRVNRESVREKSRFNGKDVATRIFATTVPSGACSLPANPPAAACSKLREPFRRQRAFVDVESNFRVRSARTPSRAEQDKVLQCQEY